MKSIVRQLYPGLFGLLIYATIRVIDDTITDFRFWERDWRINAIEIAASFLLGYILKYLFERLFGWFDRRAHHDVGYRTILWEIFWVAVLVELCVNLTITPLAAFTDDGLSWGDFAAINIIPLLYCLIYYAVTRASKLLRAYIDNKLQLEKVTNDQLQTELKFLRAQYHPHFLFNALNTIYFQMDEDVGAAKKTIEKFSELLRYQLYDQQQTVPISQEILYLKNFIEIQKVRSSERLQVRAFFDDQLSSQQVYPLLLLPLVENAFKYVGGEYRIEIDGRSSGEAIHFMVSNSLPAEAVVSRQNGIGLENLKRRLELLYPGRHALSIEKTGDRYTTNLQIQPGNQ